MREVLLTPTVTAAEAAVGSDGATCPWIGTLTVAIRASVRQRL